MLVVFLGLDKAGKTSIKVYLETLDTEKARNTRMSNGVEAYQRGDVKFEVFPGQFVLRMNERLYEVFFPHTHKIVFTVDAADKKRFSAVKEYWRFVKRMIEKYCDRTPNIILLAHKQDLDDAVSPAELEKIIFDKEDFSNYSIETIGTSIYDPLSMSLLLRTIHGASKIGIEQIVDTLREKTGSDVAFLYDSHLLPIAVSTSGRDSEIITLINDLIISIEKIGELTMFAGYFKGNRNIVAVSEKIGEDRILVGVFNFRVKLKEALDLCMGVHKHYISELRRRMWGGW